MKPFNLAEALAGKPVVNGYGSPIVSVTHIPAGKTYQLVGVDSVGQITTYTIEGMFNSCEPDSQANLFMAPVEKRVWLNIWLNDDHGVPFIHTGAHDSLLAAIAAGQTTRTLSGNKKKLLQRIEVTWEE